MYNNLIIIQARFSSTRLPGKVLQPIWKEKHLLDLQIDRLRKTNIPFVIATTTNPADDVIEQWAKDKDIRVFRGDEQNVLGRFIECAHQFEAKQLIRVCSDNPFIQFKDIPIFFDELNAGVDYISYRNHEGLPAIRTHWGLFVEGVTLEALIRASKEIKGHDQELFYREHVTNFIYEHRELFRVKLPPAPDAVFDRSDLRFTIDTVDDFSNLAELLGIVDGDFDDLNKLVNLTDNNPKFLDAMYWGIKSFDK